MNIRSFVHDLISVITLLQKQLEITNSSAVSALRFNTYVESFVKIKVAQYIEKGLAADTSRDRCLLLH